MNVLLIIIIKIAIISGDNNIPFFLQSTAHRERDFPLQINKSANPCSNFYEYACHDWISKSSLEDVQPNWNHWQVVAKKITRRLEKMLKTEKSTSKYFLKAQDLFKNCLRNTSTEGKYVHNLKKLIKHLKGWPMANSKWSSIGYDWFVEVAKITRNLGIYPLIKMHVFINMKNISENILYIERGELNLPQQILTNPGDYPQFIRAYESWIFKVVEYLYPSYTNFKLTQAALDLVTFEVELAKLHNIKDKSTKITVKELEAKLSLNWNLIFKALFYETSVRMQKDEPVILRCENYLKHLQRLIAKTKVETLADYIVWSVVKHLSRETSDYMRKLSFTMDNVVLGIKEESTQTEECISTVATYMDTALIMDYSRLYVHPKTVKSVIGVIENVKQALIDSLTRNTWLESPTRQLAIQKIEAMNYHVGYPDRLDKLVLDEKFGKVNISNNHFLNVLQMKAIVTKHDLENLRLKPNLV